MEIKARIIIEILGSPEEHVVETMKKVMEEFEQRKVSIIKKEVSEVDKVEKFFSSFADIEFKTDSLKKLNEICFDFMPSVIEIIEPLDLKFESKDYEDFMNDLLARLHKHGMIMRNLHAENVYLKQKKD